MSNFLNFAGNSGVTFKSFTASGGTTYTLDKSASTNSVLVSVGGVLQKPSTDYSVSGTTLTTTSTVTTGIVIDTYIIHDAGNAPVIEDNSIVTAKIADSQITRGKLDLISTSSEPGATIKGDGTTDGYIQLNCSQNSHGIKLKSPAHSAGASYTLTFPTTDGNANEFLQTNGSGVMTWAEAGGGAYNFISDTNCSGASSFEINDLPATYDNFLLLMTGVKNNNSVSYLRTTVGTSASYASSGYYWSRWGVGIGNGGSGATVSQSGNYFEFSSQGPTNSVRNYQMHIHRKSNGTTRCTFFGFNMGQENATWDESHYTFGGFIDTGSLIDDIKFEFLSSTGQITVSSARLYGIANS